MKEKRSDCHYIIKYINHQCHKLTNSIVKLLIFKIFSMYFILTKKTNKN